MIKVMIADDEQYEREYLQRFMAEHYAGSLDVVYMAKDGAEVLEEVDRCNPDIIMMDIRMPRLDGLEAAAQLLRKHPDLQLIIVSAYGEFSYAKKALKLGVKDFLVKPYLDDELADTLDKAISTQMKNKVNDFEKIKEPTAFDFCEDMDKDLVWNVAFARKDDEALKKALAMWGVEQNHFKCVVFFHDSLLNMGETGYEIIKGMFYIEHTHAIVSYLLNQMVVYIFADREDAFGEINSCVKKVRTYLKELEPSTVFCGVSAIYDDAREGKKAYEEAAGYITEYTDAQTKEKFDSATSASSEICNIEDKACFYLINKNEEQTLYWFNQLQEFYKNAGKPEYNYIKQNFRRSLLTIIRSINRIPEIRLTTSDVVELFLCFSDEDVELDKLASNITTRLLEHWNDTPLNNNTMIVRRAKVYLRDHYSEAISLQSVAEELEISSGYLSKCFKNVEGTGFTEYLTKLRLEKAKELIRKNEMTITEIAYQVGFTDPNYFGKCFKKNEQISPKEYLTLHAIQK